MKTAVKLTLLSTFLLFIWLILVDVYEYFWQKYSRFPMGVRR